jgi:hypothetical protein
VAPDEPSAVRQDLVLYGQLMAGSIGTGVGAGLRIPSSHTRAIDLSFVTAGNGRDQLTAIGAKVLTYVAPDLATSWYAGGGLSAAVQNEGSMEESGVRLEGTAGVMLNRTGSTRMFLQADLGLPLYSVANSYNPTFMFSFGIGQ